MIKNNKFLMFYLGSTFSSPSKKSQGSTVNSPIRLGETRSSIDGSLNTTTQDIENDEDFLGRDDFVPITMYEALEKSVQKLSSTVQTKENSLAEKDEVVEMLERKMSVLEKARSSELRQSKKRESDLKDEITALKERLEFIEEEYRVRFEFSWNFLVFNVYIL